MKKLIYTATVVLSLSILSSCTKENDVAPSINKTMTEDVRDKSDVGTADIDGGEPRDKSDVGTADANGGNGGSN
jgi:hypothetical protein